MEIARRYLVGHASPLAAYLALQRALIRRFVASGGSPAEFCERLAPVCRRRYAPLFFGAAAEASHRGPPPPLIPGPAARRAP